MSWPRSIDYFEAVQNLRSCMSDEELLGGQAALNNMGLPLLWAGGFADVYRIECPATGNTWALKCFTRQVANQCERYRQISAHLDQVKLPFTVDFQYLESGIRISGRWFPALKMRWVEGLELNQFVESHLDSPKMLDQLLGLWPKLAERLRAARMAHADLQHGNVLLVPKGKQLALRLIDYDGMYVPALAGRPSGELGHPAYQHPQRLREGTYSAEVDRFSHLAIYCAVRCLRVGRRKLWQEFSNDDNLLFRESDFRNPGASNLFRALWALPDTGARVLAGRLALACQSPLEQVPHLHEVLLKGDGKVVPLDAGQESELKSLLSPKLTLPAVPSAVDEPKTPLDEVQGAITTQAISTEGTAPAIATDAKPSPPQYRSLLKRIAAPIRTVDRLLLAMVGQDNTILHNFVRVVATVILVAGMALAGWRLYEQVLARPARELAAAHSAEIEAARRKAEEEAAERVGGGEQIRAFMPHDDSLMYYATAFSSDGSRVLTGTSDSSAFLRDTGTGEQIRTFEGHNSVVLAVAFSADSTRVLTGSWDTTAILWDASTGEQISVFKGHNWGVIAVAFSPDGKRVLTGSADNTAILWNAATGAQIRAFKGHRSWVKSVAFSPDGQRVLTGCNDRKVILWDAATGRQIRVFLGHRRWIDAVAFSPNGKQVLSGAWDKTAILWDASTGKQIHAFKEHNRAACSVAFSPNGQRALTGSDNGAAILWNANTGSRIHVFKGHNDIIHSVAFSPDGRRVLTGCRDGTVIVWNANLPESTAREKAEEEARQKKTEEQAARKKAEQEAALRKSAQDKAKAKRKAAICGVPTHVFKGHTKAVWSAAFSPDGKQVLTGSDDGSAILWNTDSGAKIKVYDGHKGRVASVAFSPDGKRLLAGFVERTAILWDVNSGKRIHVFDEPANHAMSVAFSPNSKRMLTGSLNHNAIFWDTDTFAGTLALSGKHKDRLAAVAFSPDGNRVLTGSYDNTAILWDANSGSMIRQFSGHRDVVWCAAFSPDGQQVLTGCWDKTAILWDVDSGEQIQTLKAHDSPVWSCAFSPDGKRILTGLEDGSAILWDASTGKQIYAFLGHEDKVTAVAFSLDGKRVLTGSGDKTAILWDADGTTPTNTDASDVQK